MFIEDLSEKKKEEIIECLQNEDFTKVKFVQNSINFQKGLRNYQLMSTNLSDQEDGLRVDFDYTAFMKEQYEEKTRHTVSLKDAVEKAGSVEDGCKKLHWHITRSEHLVRKNSQWIADIHTDYIYEVRIGDHMHVIVNENDENQEAGLKVYAGTMDALWRMGTVPVNDLFSNSNLPALLKKLS